MSDDYNDVVLIDEERAILAEDVDEVETVDDGAEAQSVEDVPAANEAADEDGQADIEAAEADDDEADPEPKNFQPALDDQAQADEARIAKEISDAEAKIGEVDEKLEDLAMQFEDGEIELAEYKKESRALRAEERKLTAAIAAANAEKSAMAAQAKHKEVAEQQYAQARWEAAVEQWKEIGDNAKYEKNPILSQYMIQEVTRIRQTEEGAALGNLAILKKARVAVDTMLQEAGFLPASTQAAPKQQRKQTSKESPVTLADAPAAAQNDTGGEFAYLDSLDGMELESAVSKLTPEQQERWARH